MYVHIVDMLLITASSLITKICFIHIGGDFLCSFKDDMFAETVGMF